VVRYSRHHHRLTSSQVGQYDIHSNRYPPHSSRLTLTHSFIHSLISDSSRSQRERCSTHHQGNSLSDTTHLYRQSTVLLTTIPNTLTTPHTLTHSLSRIDQNYTGDKINFGLAAEIASLRWFRIRADTSVPCVNDLLTSGVRVESVIVADDVALLPEGESSVVDGIHLSTTYHSRNTSS